MHVHTRCVLNARAYKNIHTHTHIMTHADAMFREKHSKKHDHPQP